MPDYGHVYADKKISEVNKQLKSTYRQAQREMKQKLKDFDARYADRSKQMKRMVAEGKISEQDYKDWLTGQVFVRQIWKSKIDQVNKILYDHNAQAMKLINNGKLDTFAENYNYQAYIAEGKMIGSFSLYNAEAVARLMLDDPKLLPEWKVEEKKDYEWNQKKVNNIVTQGIIQGMSVPEITRRLCEGLATQNDDRMRTFARTAMTGAENAGRQRQMNDAADMGIEVNKRWEATHDSRTRDSHRAIDGEEVPYNEDFSNGLEYPGDPAGDPAEVYNCRCTMVTIYPKYEDRESSARRYEEMDVEGQSYEDWKKYDSYKDWKKAKEKTTEQPIDPYAEFNKTLEAYGYELNRLGYSEETKKELAHILFVDGWKKLGLTQNNYWLKLVNGELKNEEVEKLLAREKPKQEEKVGVKEEDRNKGLELYRTFIEGGSSQIHAMAGYVPFGGGYNPALVNDEQMRLLDTVFEPATEELHRYKGSPMTDEEIEQLKNGGFINHTLSSTTTDVKTAEFYMGNASEELGTKPVLMDITVEPGVPIADARALLGNDGQKAFEKETTIGRNVEWEVKSVKLTQDKFGDEYYIANVVIHKPENNIAFGGQNDTINTGGYTGAKKTPGWEDRHADLYYQEVRNRKVFADAEKIAAHTPFTREEIEEVRRYVFVDEHDLGDRKARFDSDYDQAQAWQRLVDGKGTKEDEEFIRHEKAEIKYVKEGCSQQEAHEKANEEHNWWKMVQKRRNK